jgi:hypothetical protein
VGVVIWFLSGVLFGVGFALVVLWWPMGGREFRYWSKRAARRLDRRWAREQGKKGPGA